MDFSPLNPALLDPKDKSNSKHGFRIDRYKGILFFFSLSQAAVHHAKTHTKQISAKIVPRSFRITPKTSTNQHNTKLNKARGKQRAKKTFGGLP